MVILFRQYKIFNFLSLSVPPVINYISAVTNVSISKGADLQCQTTGFPKSNITWLKNGMELILNGGIQQVDNVTGDLEQLSVLMFQSVVRTDTATYTCVATNMIEATLSAQNDTQLVVLGK